MEALAVIALSAQAMAGLCNNWAVPALAQTGHCFGADEA